MGKLIERLRDALLGTEANDSHGTAPAVRIVVECAKCGEHIAARIEKAHELQEVYAEEPPPDDEEEHAVGYMLRKELVGANCQNIISLQLAFDECRQITQQSSNAPMKATVCTAVRRPHLHGSGD